MTHHYAVQVMQPADNEQEHICTVFTEDEWPYTSKPLMPSGFHVEEALEPICNSHNPSPERHGLIIKLACETIGCGITDVKIYQHEGTTFFKTCKGLP